MPPRETYISPFDPFDRAGYTKVFTFPNDWEIMSMINKCGSVHPDCASLVCGLRENHDALNHASLNSNNEITAQWPKKEKRLLTFIEVKRILDLYFVNRGINVSNRFEISYNEQSRKFWVAPVTNPESASIGSGWEKTFEKAIDALGHTIIEKMKNKIDRDKAFLRGIGVEVK